MTDQTTSTPSVRPIVIIGAPRSGTNMLRDALCTHPALTTWPCDEINYIWRHGHRAHPSDEFPESFATPTLARFVRGRFEEIAMRNSVRDVVEKTCANSLRVGFVRALLPDARFIFIFREGAAATVSASLRWRARYDLPYLAAKARFVPLSDVPYYGWRFLRDRVHRLTSRERRAAYWGPRVDGLQEVLEAEGLLPACAAQWSACVTASIREMRVLAPTQRHVVRYEEFTRDPVKGLSDIGRFLSVAEPPNGWQDAAAAVRDQPVRDPLASLDSALRDHVSARLAPGREALAQIAGQ